MTLSRARDGPILFLTVFGAVNPLLAATTPYNKEPKYFFEAGGTVPDWFSILNNIYKY